MSIEITEFTDPGCPFAFSAEPHRWRILWLYADADVAWRRRMVVLARSPQEYLDKGFTPAKQSASFARLADEHGMPIDTRERPRTAATLPACTAVVAARLRAPEREGAILRALRLRHLGRAQLLDEDETIAAAARDAGLDPDEVFGWMAEPAVRETLEEDVAAARNPTPAARVLDHKLAAWPGGRRYTCPSYEIERIREADVVASIPGFQPFAVYEVALANLLPGVARRPRPESVGALLEWAGEPLATAEVAAVCELSRDEAAERLSAVARRIPMGGDALWELA